MVISPENGTTVNEATVVITGLAQPGAVVTRDIPFWFDEHTTADDAGEWSFSEPLNQGENVFTFRVGDDTSTQILLTIYYAPA